MLFHCIFRKGVIIYIDDANKNLKSKMTKLNYYINLSSENEKITLRSAQSIDKYCTI